MQQILPQQLARWLESPESRPGAPVLLDVREDWEARICRLPNSIHMPMHEIPARLGELDSQRPIVCMCHHGMRSQQVASFLQHHGIPDVYNLAGGIDAWAREVDASCPTY